VKPDSTGTIYFQLFNSDGGRAYLNALTIDGVPSANMGIAQTPVATQAIKNGQGTGTAASFATFATTTTAVFSGPTKVSAFPNPFVDEISLSLQLSRPVARLLVRVTDVSGRVVFGQELHNLPQGASQQQLSIKGGNLSSGSYFIELQGLPEGNRKTIQLLKMKR
jgi:large repetitive protein